MRIQTKDLTGTALGWAVGKSAGKNKNIRWSHPHQMLLEEGKNWASWNPERNWAFVGEIIEAHCPTLIKRNGIWEAEMIDKTGFTLCFKGSSPHVAVLRGFVARELGPEVDIPDELT